MLVSMMNFDAEKRSVLVIVIESDNFKRMQKADPITLESLPAGGVLPSPGYPQNFSVLVGYEEDEVALYRLARQGAGEFVRYLERGRTWDESTDGKKNTFRIPTA